MIITNAKERGRFLRFAFVGVVGAVVDGGTYNLLFGLFKMPVVIAGSISFSLAVVSNFIWNRYWTYPDSRSKSISFQLGQFIIISLIGLFVLRDPLLAWLPPKFVSFFDKVSISSLITLPISKLLTPTFLGNNLAWVIAVLVVMMWNFFANRYWTYSDVSAK